MKRYEDIQELLSSVAENIARVDEAYKNARTDEDVKAVSRPVIKSCLEHLRSCLEYSAQDMYETKIGGSKIPYFPYGEDEKKFRGSVSNNLPSIEKLAPNLYKHLLAIQPFICNDDWLTTLCKHTNFNKHNRLTTPDRVNSTKSVTNFGPLGQIQEGTIVMDGCFINGVLVGGSEPLVLDNKRSVAEMRSGLPDFVPVSREFEWVEFRFPGTPTDALRLIKKSHHEIGNFVELVKNELT